MAISWARGITSTSDIVPCGCFDIKHMDVIQINKATLSIVVTTEKYQLGVC